MVLAKVFRLLILIAPFADLTLQKIDSSECYYNKLSKPFQGKFLSQDTTWHLMKKFHVNDFAEKSLVYKVSDLVKTFFLRRKFPRESVEEGIIVLSANSSPLGAWEYYDEELNGTEEIGTSADENWKEISSTNENLLTHLAVPHWHVGAVGIEYSCQYLCNRKSLDNTSASDCQGIFEPRESPIFISHKKYIRFKRRRMFWNYFQGSEKTKIIFRPVYVSEKGLPPSPKGNLYGNPYSDLGILRAEWTDCSGEEIFTQPKWLDECGLCGGDNSSCKICDKGEILYRGRCRNIVDLLPTTNEEYYLNFSSTDCSNLKERLNFHLKKTEINVKSNSMVKDDMKDKIAKKSMLFQKDFIELQAKMTPFSKEMDTTIIKMGSIEIKGPDAVYPDDETLMQVQPTSHRITNTQFTFKWKHHWQINGTLRKGIDWIQQGTKLIITRNVLKPLSQYNISTFMEIENAPGIVYTASRLLSVNSKGILAVLNVTHTEDSHRFLQFDASSSQDIDMPNNKYLQFAWMCQSMTTDSLCDCNLDQDLSSDDLKLLNENNQKCLMKRRLKVDTDLIMPGRYKWSVTVFNSFSLAVVSHTFEVHPKSTINSTSNNREGESNNITNNAIIVKSGPLFMITNEESLEKLRAISIQLSVKPTTSTENSFGTLFSFIISFIFKTEIDLGFFQKLSYNIGYVLSTHNNENRSVSENENILWLQTSSVLVNTTWDYLPSGENVTPVVKVCASSFQCTVTFAPIVKVTSGSLSPYNGNKIGKIFENKIHNIEIDGAIAFMCTTFISLRHFGKEVLQNKLSPIFSNVIEDNSLIIFESSSMVHSYGFKNSIWSLKEAIPMNNILKRLVKRVKYLQTKGVHEATRNIQLINKNTFENTVRVKRNSSLTVLHEHEKSAPLLQLNGTDDTNETQNDVMNNVFKMCEALRNPNKSEEESKPSSPKIKVLYIKDLLSHSSADFHIKIDGVENSKFALIDFEYFLKRHFSKCGNGTKKRCHSVCATAVYFHEVFLKPSEQDFENSMLEVMAYHSNSSISDLWSKTHDNFGPVLLEFNINEIGVNHTAECRVWDDEQNDWNNTCHSAIVNKDNFRILQCFCKKMGYLKILESDISRNKSASSLEQKRVEFSIVNSDPQLTVGKLRAIFEVYLVKQLTKVLNITEVEVETWNPFPGGVIVSMLLMNTITKNHRKKNFEYKSLESIVQLLDSKITNGTLLLLDLENRPLNISQSSITRRIPEEVNLVLGIIIGSVLIIGIATFSVSSFRKYHKEKLDSVRPIKHYDGVQDIDNKFENTYNGNHVSSEELGTDINYDGISCIDSSEITVRRVTSMSESQSNNPKRSSAYINTNTAELNHLPHDASHSISVTHSSGEYGISTFPNMIIN